MNRRNVLAFSAAVLIVAGSAFSIAAASPASSAPSNDDAVPDLKNPQSLKWEKTIPSAGDRSPEYALLHTDPKTNLTTLMFRTPVPVYIKPHTHSKAETHVVLEGGTHVFLANGKRYEIEKGGYLRMPGGTVHEAWLPAGSVTVNIEESGWVVNWLQGGPSEDDIGKVPPKTP